MSYAWDTKEMSLITEHFCDSCRGRIEWKIKDLKEQLKYDPLTENRKEIIQKIIIPLLQNLLIDSYANHTTFKGNNIT